MRHFSNVARCLAIEICPSVFPNQAVYDAVVPIQSGNTQGQRASNMNQSRFRMLLTISIATGLASGFIDKLFPSLTPEQLRLAHGVLEKSFYDEFSLTQLLLSLFSGAFILISIAVAAFGLYRFSHWAPRAMILATVLSVFCWFLLPARTYSGLALSMFTLSNYLWGGILVLSCTPPCSGWFSKEAAASRGRKIDA